MRYGSVCSGIEAASAAWGPLGWKPAWFAEVEPFPSAVLAHHHPSVPNFGDMTELPGLVRLGAVEAPDVLVGGTPCQSWSVAGKREGRNDPRGELTFSFLEVIREGRPKWVVWENVPGILSTNKGADFCQFLDAILGLGYYINCDILDAQFFGLAQRRRRVFLACHRADILMQQKTSTSALIGAITAAEILQTILGAHIAELKKGRNTSDCHSENVGDGLRRKILSFSAQGDELWGTWQQNCIDTFLKSVPEHAYSGSSLGHITKTGTRLEINGATSSSDFTEQEESLRKQYSSTSQLWRTYLGELFDVAKSYTTLTELKTITDEKIYVFAEMLNIIGRYIARSKNYSPTYWRAVQSFLTTSRKVIKYARQPNREVLRDARLRGLWADLVREAELANKIIEDIGAGNIGEVLPVSKSVRRDTPPSRETGETIARFVAGGAGEGSAEGFSVSEFAGYRAGIPCLRSEGGDLGGGSESLVVGVGAIAYGLRTANTSSNGWGIQEQVTHTLDQASPHAVAFAHVETMPTLRAGAPVGGAGHGARSGDSKDEYIVPIGWSEELTASVDMAGTLQYGGQGGRHDGVMTQEMQVRRLTPTECERLQGFPDSHTAITYRGKPAADGPRYKALGNSMAVPVMRWIGQRIDAAVSEQ